MKKIAERVVYVTYNFGGGAYVTVGIYEGMTFADCVKLRSENIDGYIDERGEYVRVA